MLESISCPFLKFWHGMHKENIKFPKPHIHQFLFNLKPSCLHLKKEWTDDVYWYQDSLPEVRMHPFLAKPFQIVSQSLPCSAKK